jgi:spore germination protein GerM
VSRTGAIALAVLCAAWATACSVSVDDNPRDIPQEARRPLEAESASVGAATGSSRIFLIDAADGGEPASLRSVARDAPSTADDALTSLFAGPTQDETELGLSTALPSGLELVSPTRRSGGTLTVDVSSQLLDVATDDAALAVAQIVATASEIDGVDAVRIRVDGVGQSWPDSDGQQVADDLTIYDYADLISSAQPGYPAVPSK